VLLSSPNQTERTPPTAPKSKQNTPVFALVFVKGFHWIFTIFILWFQNVRTHILIAI
jgi:hypothetical protein